MNITRIFPYFAGLALLATSCANENVLQEVQPGNGTISFTLGGSAKPKTTRATVTGEDKESHIDNVLAVLFDKEAGFYKTVEANGIVDGKYEFNVERDGSYDIYFVANADADLKEKLQSIVPGTKITGTENVLENITATQAPDVDNQFLMLSTTRASVEKIAVKDTRDLGTISMKRLAARFDIVNRAPGITITGITLKNRALKSAVSSPNTEPTDISDWYDTQRYDATTALDSWPEDFKCENDANPVAFGKTIYSYENFSGTTGFSSENIPVIEIEYLDEDGETVRTHEIMLKDSETGEARAVLRNHLYRITLHGKYDLKFNLEVLDWNDAATFDFKDMPFDTYTTYEQEVKNKELLASRFWVEGGLARDKYTNYSSTLNGETYNIPSVGYLVLLVPNNGISFTSKHDGAVFTENLKWNPTFKEGPSPTSGYNLTGNSQIISGKTTSAVYGLRFKGTKQFAAYKWEWTSNGGTTIKIKALPQESNLQLSYIVDNEKFWASGCIIYNLGKLTHFVSTTEDIERYNPGSYYMYRYWYFNNTSNGLSYDTSYSTKDSYIPLKYLNGYFLLIKN